MNMMDKPIPYEVHVDSWPHVESVVCKPSASECKVLAPELYDLFHPAPQTQPPAEILTGGEEGGRRGLINFRHLNRFFLLDHMIKALFVKNTLKTSFFPKLIVLPHSFKFWKVQKFT